MKHLYFFILIPLLFSCGQSTDRKGDIAYFGGQIVNPNEDFVLLFKDNTLIDTINLDKNNRFLLQIDSVLPGLYHFWHSPEYQYVHIEPGDSILLRLNTFEFDESLVFSGKGGEKNNFLLETYLDHEEETDYTFSLYEFPPEHFMNAVDSMQHLKLNKFDKFIVDNEISENAQTLLLATINYPHYRTKELYPFRHKNKFGRDNANEMPDNFYAFRKEVDFNNEMLSHYRQYINYLKSYVNGATYEYCNDLCDRDVTSKSLHYSTHKMELIDSVVKADKVKNILLRHTATSYLFDNHEHVNDEKFLTMFFKYSTNPQYDREIDDLYHNIQNVQKGKPLPIVNLVDVNGNELSTQDLNKNEDGTIYYFWSIYEKRHLRSLNRKITKYQNRFPNLQFIGININSDQEKWMNTLATTSFNSKSQFRAKNFESMKEKLIIPRIHKTIIVDGNGKIVNAFANLFDADFERQLTILNADRAIVSSN
ncbi:thioredoxin-like domain-containing protein [Spongiivirga sp. MCCC 1A20706]|uniref:TlpA family protein disulfide reductase n=1 Tax=Spongiivirga sp. MCCC 1A20706 TaxID=3160963 RepID=UPI0039779E3B